MSTWKVVITFFPANNVTGKELTTKMNTSLIQVALLKTTVFNCHHAPNKDYDK